MSQVAIEDVVGVRASSPLQKLMGSQAFWVTLAVIIIGIVMSFVSPVFASADNLFNVTRNFAFIGIIALGMTAVIGLSLGQVGQRPYEMGYKAMYILKDLADGKAVQDPIYTGLDVCTPDNQDDCLSG